MSGKLDGLGWKNAVNLMGIQSPPGRALGLKDKKYNKRLERSKASVDSVGTKKRLQRISCNGLLIAETLENQFFKKWILVKSQHPRIRQDLNKFLSLESEGGGEKSFKSCEQDELDYIVFMFR